MATQGTNLTGGRLVRLADLAYRRRGLMVLGWIAILVAVVAGVSRLTADFDVDFGTPGSESDAAADVLEEHFPQTSGESVNVVWKSEAGAASPAVGRRVDRFLSAATRLDDIGEAGPPRISRDGTVGLVALALEQPAWDVPTATGERLIELAEEADGHGLQLEVGGNLIRNAQGGTSPEMAGLLAAAVILLVAFGSVVAAGLPLLIAVFGLGISTTLIGVLAAFVDVP